MQQRKRGVYCWVHRGFDMRIHLRPCPLYPYSYLCGGFPFSTGIFGVPEQQGLWEPAKVNECSKRPTFSLHAYPLHTTQRSWKPQQSDHYPCITGRWLYPVAFCLMSFGNADNEKAPIQCALCWYSRSSSFSRLIISHNYCTKGGGQCAAFWPFMMLLTDSCSEQTMVWAFLLLLFIYPLLIVPERPVWLSSEECRQLLLAAQQHYRVIDPPQFLWLSGKLFTTAPHEAMNICEMAHSMPLVFTHSWLK